MEQHKFDPGVLGNSERCRYVDPSGNWCHKLSINPIHAQTTSEPAPQLFIVRLYDGMDNQWIDVSAAVSQDEARKIWLEKTENGTKRISFDEIDYYKVFPADTTMLYSGGFGEG